MFHRSILENVRYGRPEATNEEVMDAMFAARCAGFIETLPNGVHTIMGERGIKLSPGQRQRIAIARAFLKTRHSLARRGHLGARQVNPRKRCARRSTG